MNDLEYSGGINFGFTVVTYKELEKIDNTTWAIGCVVFWIICTMVVRLYCEMFSSHYSTKAPKQKWEYITYVIAFNHAWVATFGAMYVSQTGCKNSHLGSTVFNDLECFTKPQDIFYKVNLITGGYLVCDLIIFAVLVQATGALAYTTYIHHGIAIPGYYGAMYMQDISVVYGVMTLFIELSTIFLNIRYFMYEWKMNESYLALANQGVLIISYAIIRIVYQTYISVTFSYWGYYNIMYQVDQKTIDEKGQNMQIYQGIALFMVLANVASQFMNYYWFQLVVKQGLRLLYRVLGIKTDQPFEADPTYQTKVNKEKET